MVVDTEDAMASPRMEHKKNCFVLDPSSPENIDELKSLIDAGDNDSWAESATEAYAEHWSPLGQARKIAEAVE